MYAVFVLFGSINISSSKPIVPWGETPSTHVFHLLVSGLPSQIPFSPSFTTSRNDRTHYRNKKKSSGAVIAVITLLGWPFWNTRVAVAWSVRRISPIRY